MKKILNISKRSANVKYAVRDVTLISSELAKQGRELLHLNIGDPIKFDHQTPPHIADAIAKALKDNKGFYAPSEGTPEAIDAINRSAQKKGIQNIQSTFVTNGASEAIELVMTTLLEKGDNILIPYPGYPLYDALTAKLEVEGRPYYLDETNDWQPDIDDIDSKIDKKTRAIVIINPNNPTGALYTKETLLKILKIAQKHGIPILADEIYDKITYDDLEHVSIASLDTNYPIITFNGLSKVYLAPGYRIGWGIISGKESLTKDFVQSVNKLLRARLCANTPMMFGIKPALDGPQTHLENLIKKMQKRRDITYTMLNGIDGITCVKPKGAFYAFPSIDVDDDFKFVKDLMISTGVVLVHGSGFGQKPKTSHFRVVFLPPDEILIDAYNKLKNFKESFDI